MRMVRAKFKLVEIHQLYWSLTSRKYVFEAQYDSSISEDLRFSKATPSGRFEMVIDNPPAQEMFVLGQCYYFDASPVPEATAAA